MKTQVELKELFHYDPITGEFLRVGLVNPHTKKIIKCNRKINTQSRGYFQVGIGDKVHPVHRVIWVWMTGELPNEIDHIDGDRSNNKWSNLRDASRKENCKNLGVGTKNTSGVIGVTRTKGTDRYVAFITVNGERIYLGSYGSLEEAGTVRKNYEKMFNFHPNHSGRESWHE